MTLAESTALAAKLFAAFAFHRDQDEATVAVYAQMLAELPDASLGLEAVDACIRGNRYLPSIADIREQYEQARESRFQRSYIGRQLNEAAPTPEERAQSERIAREFLAKLNASFDERAKAFTTPSATADGSQEVAA